MHALLAHPEEGDQSEHQLRKLRRIPKDLHVSTQEFMYVTGFLVFYQSMPQNVVLLSNFFVYTRQ